MKRKIFLNERALSTMCEQLDALSRQIYISYGSCKATGARELYVESLRTLFGDVREVIRPVLRGKSSMAL